MAVASVEVFLEGEEVSYQSGDKLKGAIIVNNHVPVSISGVELQIRGFARAVWTDVSNSTSTRTDVEHEKEEIYFDDRFSLWGSVTNGNHWVNTETLPTGRHLFPFCYKVPTDLPCSFEGPGCCVRYVLIGTLIKNKGDNTTAYRYFSVVRDLKRGESKNMSPSTRHPLEDYAERSESMICCRPGRISCSLSITKRAYVPGETLLIDVQLHNMSIRKSGPCQIILKQLLNICDSTTRTCTLRVWQLSDGLKAGERKYWKQFGLHLPPTCPSKLEKCNILDVRYCIAVEAKFTDVGLYAAVPIIICTIPEEIHSPGGWIYKECIPFKEEKSNGTGEAAACEDLTPVDISFKPKYKYYNHLPPRSTTKGFVVQFKSSPGVKRRRQQNCGIPPQLTFSISGIESSRYSQA